VSPATASHQRPDRRLAPAIRDRWSPRAFDETHQLSDGELGLLLEAARWAPSAGNSQPWAFIVGLRGDETFEAFHALHSRGNTAWTGRASALVITLHQAFVEPGSDLPFSDYAAYDLGQAAAQLALQAQSMGLHTHQFAGFDHAGVAERFAVPPHWKVTTGMTIGKLASANTLEPALAVRERRPRERRDLAEFVFAGAFGEPAPRV
jgi:nitroreductase